MNGKYKEVIKNVFTILLFITIFFGTLYLCSLDKTPQYKYEIVCKTKTIYCNEIGKYQDYYQLRYTDAGDEEVNIKIDDVLNIKIL
jgi:hypothetical protein